MLPPNTTATGAITAANGVVRTFYIRAENVSWDFAPHGFVACTQANYSARSSLYLHRTNVTIGSGM